MHPEFNTNIKYKDTHYYSYLLKVGKCDDSKLSRFSDMNIKYAQQNPKYIYIHKLTSKGTIRMCVNSILYLPIWDTIIEISTSHLPIGPMA